MRFVEKFLAAGMTVLDVGAHHGLYTLLAAKRVGRTGRVVAFEPSAREQDLRTRPWGYRAREIVRLAGIGYRWFELDSEGRLKPVSIDLAIYDANLVAVPEERVAGYSNVTAPNEI